MPQGSRRMAAKAASQATLGDKTSEYIAADDLGRYGYRRIMSLLQKAYIPAVMP